jgi:hypothetical protein
MTVRLSSLLALAASALIGKKRLIPRMVGCHRAQAKLAFDGMLAINVLNAFLIQGRKCD